MITGIENMFTSKRRAEARLFLLKGSAALPISCTTKSDLQNARKSVRFCYLCGRILKQASITRNTEINADHVIPKGILNLLKPDDAMPLILDVHSSPCHSDKSTIDNDISVLNRMMYSGPDYISIEDQGTLRRIFEFQNCHLCDDGRFAVKLAYDPCDAVWNYVRRIHAALYHSFLPDNTRKYVYSPGPDGSPGPSATQAQIQEARNRSHYLKTNIALWTMAMSYYNCTDKLSCWNDACQYESIWTNHKGMYRCYWILSLPGDMGYGISCGDIPLPWCGWYDIKQPISNINLYTENDVSCCLEKYIQVLTLRDTRDILVSNLEQIHLWNTLSSFNTPKC